MEPLSLAETFLREAVHRSRERQAALSALRAPAIRNPNCGLGERAAVELDLSPRAAEIFERMFPGGLVEGALPAIHALMTDWIERQDALDRKRNHFLKEFRGRHGFDRTRYAPEVLADFESGLARINGEEDAERRAAAERLLGAGSGG